MANNRNQKAVLPRKAKGINKILKELKANQKLINDGIGEEIGHMLSEKATKIDRERVLSGGDAINKKFDELLEAVHELDDVIRKLKRK